MDLLIVGNRGGANVGGSFERAGQRLGLRVHLLEMKAAMKGPGPLPRIYWRLCDRRPWRLQEFSEDVAAWCEAQRPKFLLATGTVPLLAASLRRIRTAGTVTVNFLTDDPWNPAHRAGWFLDSLPEYDTVFTPRRANERDLQKCGVQKVEYCTFGYDPDLFPAESPDRQMHDCSTEWDVFFAGGADAERAETIGELEEAGLSVALYGSYWERYPETRRLTRGQLPAEEIYQAARRCKVALCLVRRANRDEHCMRTFEMPAIGMAMVAEDTADHRVIFGAEGECVLYFHSLEEMVDKARQLVVDSDMRRRLALAGQRRIIDGGHRYEDRLRQILAGVGSSAA